MHRPHRTVVGVITFSAVGTRNVVALVCLGLAAASGAGCLTALMVPAE